MTMWPKKPKSRIQRLEQYTGDTTPTVVPKPGTHTCHIPRTAKANRIYACICGQKFRYNDKTKLGEPV